MNFKYLSNSWVVLIIFFSVPYTLISQSINGTSFEAELILGVIFSQLDQDGADGFSKSGIRGGFAIKRALSNHFKAGIGLSYDQRGSSTEKGNIHLNYLSLIFDMHYVTSNNLGFRLGLLPSWMIHESSSHSEFNANMGQFDDLDWAFTVGIIYQINERVFVDLSLFRSLSSIYESMSGIKSLQNYSAGIQLGYRIK